MYFSTYTTDPFSHGAIIRGRGKSLTSSVNFPYMGDKADSGIGLSYRPARLHTGCRAGTTSLCGSQLYPPFRNYEFGYCSEACAERGVRGGEVKPLPSSSTYLPTDPWTFHQRRLFWNILLALTTHDLQDQPSPHLMWTWVTATGELGWCSPAWLMLPQSSSFS